MSVVILLDFNPLFHLVLSAQQRDNAVSSIKFAIGLMLPDEMVIIFVRAVSLWTIFCFYSTKFSYWYSLVTPWVFLGTLDPSTLIRFLVIFNVFPTKLSAIGTP